MASRQKDIKTFLKKLTKRYPTTLSARPADSSVLSQLVFAIFLENSSFDKAGAAYEAMEQYFIDWNEIRVSRANEIADVVKPLYDVLKVGERLRRLLQWIFDKDFQFDVELVRAFTPQERLDYLEAIPYTTRFMNDLVRLTTFNEPCLPLDEGALRVLRLWGMVEVDAERQIEVVSGLEKAGLSIDELRALCFALHSLGAELLDDELSADALKFIVSCDPAAAKRSVNPLVVPKRLSDPVEIARLLEKQSRMAASARKEEFVLDDSDDVDQYQEDGDFDDDDSEQTDYDVDVEETSLSRDDASYGVANAAEKPEPKSRRSAKAATKENFVAVLTPAEEKVQVSDTPVVKPEVAKAKAKPAKKAATKRAKAADAPVEPEKVDVKAVASDTVDDSAAKAKVAKPKKSAAKASKEDTSLVDNLQTPAEEKATPDAEPKTAEKTATKKSVASKKSSTKARKSDDSELTAAVATPAPEESSEKAEVTADAKSTSKKSTKSAKSAKSDKAVEETAKKRPSTRKKDAVVAEEKDTTAEPDATKKASAKKDSATRKSTRRATAEPAKTNAMEPPDESADDANGKEKASAEKEPKKATTKRASTSRKSTGEKSPTKVDKNQQKKPR